MIIKQEKVELGKKKKTEKKFRDRTAGGKGEKGRMSKDWKESKNRSI